MLTNFNCGVLYVSNDWEIPEIQNEELNLMDDTNDVIEPKEKIEMIQKKPIQIKGAVKQATNDSMQEDLELDGGNTNPKILI